jgi:pyruvate/2-oxoglutarate dehydrogenase complex dihydrolipoamide acyltransferase (E2) component
MKFEMKMPDLATTDSAVKVLNWLVGIGSPIRRGQAVIEVETDKATMEVEATVNGTLVEKKCEPSAQVGVGEVIAIIEIEDATENPSSPAPQPAPSVEVENTPAPAPLPAPKKSESMFARNRAVRKPPA